MSCFSLNSIVLNCISWWFVAYRSKLCFFGTLRSTSRNVGMRSAVDSICVVWSFHWFEFFRSGFSQKPKSLRWAFCNCQRNARFTLGSMWNEAYKRYELPATCRRAWQQANRTKLNFDNSILFPQEQIEAKLCLNSFRERSFTFLNASVSSKSV